MSEEKFCLQVRLTWINMLSNVVLHSAKVTAM